MKWQIKKDGAHVLRSDFKILEVFKMPHGSYCCFVFNGGKIIASEGYHGTSLTSISDAKDWGIKKAKQLKLLK